MKKIIVAVMMSLPQLLFAATDCLIREYPDHYLLQCTGDKSTDPVTTQTTHPAGSTAQTQPTQTTLATEAGQSINKAQAEARVSSENVNAPRPGRMSKARVATAIAARNKLLQAE